jgi:formylmethanofuran dehydrogenase subunit E-like metal-binding protein
MKVKDLIEQLTAYTPDTELLVAYWDKATIEDYAYDHLTDELTELTDTQWEEVVSKYQDGEWNFQSYATDLFVDLVGEVLETASPND